MCQSYRNLTSVSEYRSTNEILQYAII